MIDVALRKIFITPRTRIAVRRALPSRPADPNRGPPDRVRSGRLRDGPYRV